MVLIAKQYLGTCFCRLDSHCHLLITAYCTPLLQQCTAHLERRVRILQQLLKVRLKPLPSLWGRSKRIRVAAVRIIPRRRRVGGAITLTTRLDPDERILVSVSSVCRRTDTEPCAFDVAPISPSLLRSRLNTVPAGVSDEVGWEAVGCEEWAQGVDVALLVAVAVALGVRWAGGDGPCVLGCGQCTVKRQICMLVALT